MTKSVINQLNFIFTPESFIVDDTYSAKNQTELKWQNDFREDRYRTLYEFGFINHFKELSLSAHYLHLIAQMFLDSLTGRAELELARENLEFEIPDDYYQRLLDSIPFVVGSENINESWLNNIFLHLHDIFIEDIRKYPGTVKMYIAEKSQHLKIAQRIYFHFVDHSDHKFPFAFMATYASKEQGKIRHVPLKYALIEYKDDRKQLLSLLSCLNKVAEISPLIAGFMKNGEMFHPIALTKEEAYELLQAVPLIEACGIKCRVPNWWQKRNNNLSMNVNIGQERPVTLGFDALLEMQARLEVNGQALTQEEIEQLLAEDEGLMYLKGQWIEINHHRLEELLEKVKQYNGTMTLKEALSMQYASDKEADVGPLITNGKWLNNFLTNLKKPDLLASQALPVNFNASLRPYQATGYTWLNYMNQLNFGACLADDMGLGKTVQVLAFLQKLHENNPQVQCLLIVPASLLGNWANEIDKFASKMSYFIMHGRSSKLLMKEFYQKQPFLVITTYGLAAKNEVLQTINWDCLILDEAQAIKNPLTKQTKAIKQIPARMKIAMTGTPIENELSNLWSLFDFLNKGLLGSSKEFKDFTKTININPQNTAKLRNMVAPFILRRLKTDKSIISDLPDKIEMIDSIQLTRKQRALYQQLMQDVMQQLEESSGMERRGLILATLTKLKQICNHPDQYLHKSDYNPKDSGKFIMLDEICKTIYEKREKVLVFTQYKEICDYLSEYLESIFHKKGFIIHGGTPIKQRQKIVEQFNSEEYYPFIVLSVKAAGTGLNLTAANHVIHFDRWWNPAVENQATDRAFRIGQKKNVFIHKFVSSGSVEEKIDALINSKKALAQEIIPSGKQSWITELNNEELMTLLRLEK